MPRWKAWEWTFGTSGTAMPGKSWAPLWGASAMTATIILSSISTRTASAQPPGIKACSSRSVAILLLAIAA